MNHRCVLGLLVAIPLLTGCQREIEVSGEVFVEQYVPGEKIPTKRPLGQAGTVVYILSGEQNAKFKKLIEQRKADFTKRELADWITRSNNFSAVFNEATNLVVGADIERANRARAGKPNSFIEAFRLKVPKDTNSDKVMTDYFGENYPHELQRFPDAWAEYQESKSKIPRTVPERIMAEVERIGFPQLPDLEHYFDLKSKDLSAVLADVKNAVADSDGKFKIKLQGSETYFIVSTTAREGSGRWYFKFKAEGQKLILSDGNRERDND